MYCMTPRHQTDELCPVAGSYQFDGYVGPVPIATSDLVDLEIDLNEGTFFPAVGMCDSACYWIPVDGMGQSLFESVRPAAPVL